MPDIKTIIYAQSEAPLPPKEGYTQGIDQDGNPYYVPTEQKRTIDNLTDENRLLKEQLQAASDQNDFLEDCIAEMAGIVYA